jgi:hypothetical protein
MPIVMITLLLNSNEIAEVQPQVNNVSLWVQQVRPGTYFAHRCPGATALNKSCDV